LAWSVTQTEAVSGEAAPRPLFSGHTAWSWASLACSVASVLAFCAWLALPDFPQSETTYVPVALLLSVVFGTAAIAAAIVGAFRREGTAVVVCLVVGFLAAAPGTLVLYLVEAIAGSS